MNLNASNPAFLAILIIAFIFILESCSAPGAPLLRNNTDDGYGLLAPDCKNISPNTSLDTYSTKYYHSTWSSAWVEGGQAGLKEGLGLTNKEGSNNSIQEERYVRFTKEFSYAVMKQVFNLDGRKYPSPPFCMIYNASIDEVSASLNEIMPVLGNPVIRGKEKFGLFGTEFTNREHRAAKWKDRYIITARETVSNQAVVTVYRELFISRKGYPFDRAESSGHNEAWILKKVAISTQHQ